MCYRRRGGCQRDINKRWSEIGWLMEHIMRTLWSHERSRHDVKVWGVRSIILPTEFGLC